MAEFHPPEGLRKIAHEAAYKAHAAGRFTVHQVVDAALAALFEACEVREAWGVRWIWPDGPVMATGGFIGHRADAERWLRKPPSDECKGELVRHYKLTTPAEPVSSTGEEPTGG